jgi:hypothetical protein
MRTPTGEGGRRRRERDWGGLGHRWGVGVGGGLSAGHPSLPRTKRLDSAQPNGWNGCWAGSSAFQPSRTGCLFSEQIIIYLFVDVRIFFGICL